MSQILWNKLFHILHGAYAARFPLVPGHEYAGVVAAVGDGVETLAVGDRVSVDPNIVCGACYFCRRGEAHLCKKLDPLGVFRDGGFAEYSVVPAAQAYKIPESVAFEHGALAEPVACCLRGVDQARIKQGDCVALLGAGPIGCIMLQLCRLAGAAKLIVSEPQAWRREIASKLGADLAVPPDEMARAVDSQTEEGADVVIECSGSKAAAEQAIKLARKGGTVVFFGVCEPAETIPLSPFEINDRELTICGSFNNPYTHSRAISLIASGKLELDPIIAPRFPLADFAKALEAFGTEGTMKILVMPKPA